MLAAAAGTALVGAVVWWAQSGADSCPPAPQKRELEVWRAKPAFARELEDAPRGDFLVLRRRAHLVPPIDWDQDPYASEAWRSKLHSLGWLGPLLVLYTQEGDEDALRQAVDVVLDWIRSNPPDEGFGWADKISGTRAGLIGFLAASADCRGILNAQERASLFASAHEHGKFLADPDRYNPGNHGLFQDVGLLQLTTYLPSLPRATEWRQLAVKRFRKRVPVHPQEGVDLEHSPGYHFLVLNLLERVLGPGDQQRLVGREVIGRMRSVAGWFVMPDGLLTRLGDTSARHAPGWAQRKAATYRGIAPTLQSGFGIVKAPGAYLSVAAGYHPYGHKQADELTFELYDGGRHVITDTGRYGAARNRRDPVKARELAFTKTSQAHSVLVADDTSFPFDRYVPYGSAIVASGSGSGWYALEGTNPLLAGEGIDHRRLFLYRPGTALIVVDQVTARRRHTYTRYFQLDPGIAVRPAGRLLRLTAGSFSAFLHDAPTQWDAGRAVVVGRRGPLPGFTRSPLLGFTTSKHKFDPLIPRAAVVYRSRGTSASHVATLSLDGPATGSLVRRAPGAVTVRLDRTGVGPVTVTAVRRGSRLKVTETSGARG